MLAKPNAKDIMSKVGTRYETAVAVAKRAREISEERIEAGSSDITDPVDVASKEIDTDKVKVLKVEESDVKLVEDVIKEDIVE